MQTTEVHPKHAAGACTIVHPACPAHTYRCGVVSNIILCDRKMYAKQPSTRRSVSLLHQPPFGLMSVCGRSRAFVKNEREYGVLAKLCDQTQCIQRNIKYEIFQRIIS